MSGGSLLTQQSAISNCIFISNIAYSGWGGAIFGTDTSYGELVISNTIFSLNSAFSSYTNAGKLNY